MRYSIKEEVEDPQIIQRIHSILIPREFTRLDEIVDVLFSATEDIRQDEVVAAEGAVSVDKKTKEPKFTPVAFHDACISRIQTALHATLIKRTRAQFSSPDKSVIVNCAVSKEHDPDTTPNYWFAFHPHQKEALRRAPKSYAAFGCGTSKRILLIPFSDFDQWLEGMWTTRKDDRFYWHVVIYRKDEKYILHRKKGQKGIDLSQYLLG